MGIFCLLHAQHVRARRPRWLGPRGDFFSWSQGLLAPPSCLARGGGRRAEGGGRGAQGGRFLPRPSEALSEWLPDVPGTDSRWRGIRATATPTRCAGCYPSGSRGPPGGRRRAAASPSGLEPELEPKDSFKVTGRGTSAAVTPTGLQCPVLGGEAVSFALSEKSPSTCEARAPVRRPRFLPPLPLAGVVLLVPSGSVVCSSHGVGGRLPPARASRAFSCRAGRVQPRRP